MYERLLDKNVMPDEAAIQEYLGRQSYERLAIFDNKLKVNFSGFIVASQTTDIFYLLCRLGMCEHSAKGIIKKLTDNIIVASHAHADHAGVFMENIQTSSASSSPKSSFNWRSSISFVSIALLTASPIRRIFSCFFCLPNSTVAKRSRATFHSV